MKLTEQDGLQDDLADNGVSVVVHRVKRVKNKHVGEEEIQGIYKLEA